MTVVLQGQEAVGIQQGGRPALPGASGRASWRCRDGSSLWVREAGVSVSAKMMLPAEALQVFFLGGGSTGGSLTWGLCLLCLSMSCLPLGQEVSGWYYLLGEDLGRTKHLKVARRRLRPLRGAWHHLHLLPGHTVLPLSSPFPFFLSSGTTPVFCGICHHWLQSSQGFGGFSRVPAGMQAAGSLCPPYLVFVVGFSHERTRGLTLCDSAPSTLAYGELGFRSFLHGSSVNRILPGLPRWPWGVHLDR